MIVTANVAPAANMRVDIDILDGSERGNIYLSKKVCPRACVLGPWPHSNALQDIKGETRLAITTHESADVGVCLTNQLIGDTHGPAMRTVDLDIDIGADAVDYK